MACENSSVVATSVRNRSVGNPVIMAWIGMPWSRTPMINAQAMERSPTLRLEKQLRRIARKRASKEINARFKHSSFNSPDEGGNGMTASLTQRLRRARIDSVLPR